MCYAVLYELNFSIRCADERLEHLEIERDKEVMCSSAGRERAAVTLCKTLDNRAGQGKVEMQHKVNKGKKEGRYRLKARQGQGS